MQLVNFWASAGQAGKLAFNRLWQHFGQCGISRLKLRTSAVCPKATSEHKNSLPECSQSPRFVVSVNLMKLIGFLK
jgi:hypothetical protein